MPELMSASEKIMSLQATPTPKAALMSRPPRISRNLDEVAGWLAELASLYRAARRNQLDTQDASRLGYLCGVAAKLARDLEELRQLEKMGKDFAELQQRQQQLPQQFDYAAIETSIESSITQNGSPP